MKKTYERRKKLMRRNVHKTKSLALVFGEVSLSVYVVHAPALSSEALAVSIAGILAVALLLYAVD